MKTIVMGRAMQHWAKHQIQLMYNFVMFTKTDALCISVVENESSISKQHYQHLFLCFLFLRTIHLNIWHLKKVPVISRKHYSDKLKSIHDKIFNYLNNIPLKGKKCDTCLRRKLKYLNMRIDLVEPF